MIIKGNFTKEQDETTDAEISLETLKDITQEINAVMQFLKNNEVQLQKHLIKKDRVELKALELLLETHGENLLNVARMIDKHLRTKTKPLTKNEINQIYAEYTQAGKYYENKRESIILQNMLSVLETAVSD